MNTIATVLHLHGDGAPRACICPPPHRPRECVGVYHCIARCVRRAFLCGIDPYSGRDYSHRKAWIIDRLRHLAGLFGVEVCGYAIMSNHLHLVLRNRPDSVEQWSDSEVAVPLVQALFRIVTIRFDGPRRRDKPGAIPEDLTPILDRLGADRSSWVHTVRDFGRMFKQAAGRASSLESAARR